MEKIKHSQLFPLQIFRNSSLQITILKSATLAFAVITLYFQDLRIVFTDALQNEANSYILLIPILFAYLIYRKRKMLAATTLSENKTQERSTKHTSTVGGALLCITALVLYMYGSQTFTPLQYHMRARWCGPQYDDPSKKGKRLLEHFRIFNDACPQALSL